MTDNASLHLAKRLGLALAVRHLKLAVAESCTGGLIAGAVTAIPGSSGWFERGFVTYSNEAKMEMLGVDAATLAAYGAVSEATAREMAIGALAHGHADVTVAVTGVAGPDGGTPEKPVGMVCFAWARRGAAAATATHHFAGNREAVRRASVEFALTGMLDRLD
jgi:nicotinamide-nucleotide amidase